MLMRIMYIYIYIYICIFVYIVLRTLHYCFLFILSFANVFQFLTSAFRLILYFLKLKLNLIIQTETISYAKN